MSASMVLCAINKFANIFDLNTIDTWLHYGPYNFIFIFHLLRQNINFIHSSLLPQLEHVSDVRVYDVAYEIRIISIESRDTLYNRRHRRRTQLHKINVNSLHERWPAGRNGNKKKTNCYFSWFGSEMGANALVYRSMSQLSNSVKI